VTVVRVIFLGLVLLAGCGWFKSRAAPSYLEQRRDELEDIQANIDLAIARSDWQRIDTAQFAVKSDTDQIKQANDAHDSVRARESLQALHGDEDDLDKAIDIAARHRGHR